MLICSQHLINNGLDEFVPRGVGPYPWPRHGAVWSCLVPSYQGAVGGTEKGAKQPDRRQREWVIYAGQPAQDYTGLLEDIFLCGVRV